jgi:hypothetical protein
MPARLPRYQTLARSGGQLAIVGVLIACAVAVAGAAVMHLVDPAHFGLWGGPHAFFFGTADAPLHVRQAQDDTLWLAALVIVTLCVLVARELFGFARAGASRQSR